ncbi:MAG: TIR domain-containing protein [Halocynthiibacter sp.]
MYQVNVFISHSWSYSGHYNTLSDWIFRKQWNSHGMPIHFIDQSIPQHDPIHNASNATQLLHAIEQRIGRSDVVVIPTGMYASYSNWISKEISSSQKLLKPIVGVNPWGQEKTSTTVRQAAHEVVNWTGQSVIDAIWRNKQ